MLEVVQKHGLRRVWAGTARYGRLAIYLVALQVVLSFVLAASAKAKMEAAFGELGAELMQFQGARYASGSRVLFVNGVRMIVRSASTEVPLARVLDHFEDMCARQGGFELDPRTLARLEAAAAGRPEQRRLLDGVWRHESATRGFVACLDMGGKQSLAEVVRRLQSFAESGDLSDVGDLRFVHAEKSGEKTAMLAMWAEGAVPVSSMFPASGDCPGQDPPRIARPAASDRFLSTWEEGSAHSLTIYRSRTPDAGGFKAHYLGELSALGWSVEERTADHSEQTVLFVRREGEALIVFLTRDAAGRAYASIGPLGRAF